MTTNCTGANSARARPLDANEEIIRTIGHVRGRREVIREILDDGSWGGRPYMQAFASSVRTGT